jgi:sugar lactone lactonase YvrE
VRVLIDGLSLGESMRWHDGRLWFCDWGTGQIARFSDGSATAVARIADFPFCIDWLPDGRMVVITGRGLLLREEPDGSLGTFVRLEAPYPWNDIAVDRAGNVFVNNIGYDYYAGPRGPGTISVVTPRGEVREAAGDLDFPNGMAFDGDTLIVAESHGSRLTAFDVAPDGGLHNRRVWAALENAAPDGICVPAPGQVWYADVPNKECVLVREGGEVLRRVPLDRGGFDCVVGDGVLYAVTAVYPSATAQGQLVAIDL